MDSRVSYLIVMAYFFYEVHSNYGFLINSPSSVKYLDGFLFLMRSV